MIPILLTWAAVASTPSPAFEVKELAPGVYAALRQEPPGLAVDANVVFIVNERDVVMVDSNIGPESAKATLAALRRITKKPVSHIIATHYHDDHVGGNDIFRRAFPDVEFVGHADSAEALETLGKPSRKGMIEAAPEMAKMLRGLLEKGQNLAGKPLTDEERTAFASDIRIAERYAREMPGVPIVPPTIEVGNRMVLRRGDRSIEVLFLGRGHTRCDLAVHLPKERIAIVGDLVVYPVPLVGGNQSYVTEWTATLEKVKALGATQIVPGHGPILKDAAYLDRLRELYSAFTTRVRAAIERKESLEEIQRSIDVSDLTAKFCGDSPLKRFVFANYVRVPSVAAVYRELKGP